MACFSFKETKKCEEVVLWDKKDALNRKIYAGGKGRTDRLCFGMEGSLGFASGWKGPSAPLGDLPSCSEQEGLVDSSATMNKWFG
jgi:hypothetical protein